MFRTWSFIYTLTHAHKPVGTFSDIVPPPAQGRKNRDQLPPTHTHNPPPLMWTCCQGLRSSQRQRPDVPGTQRDRQLGDKTHTRHMLHAGLSIVERTFTDTHKPKPDADLNPETGLCRTEDQSVLQWILSVNCVCVSVCVTCQTGSRPSVSPCWTVLRRKTLTCVKTTASSSTQHSKYVTPSTTAVQVLHQSVTVCTSNNTVVCVCSIFVLTVHRWTEGRRTEVRHAHVIEV